MAAKQNHWGAMKAKQKVKAKARESNTTQADLLESKLEELAEQAQSNATNAAVLTVLLSFILVGALAVFVFTSEDHTSAEIAELRDSLTVLIDTRHAEATGQQEISRDHLYNKMHRMSSDLFAAIVCASMGLLVIVMLFVSDCIALKVADQLQKRADALGSAKTEPDPATPE
jgi:hypothetical protein